MNITSFWVICLLCSIDYFEQCEKLNIFGTSLLWEADITKGSLDIDCSGPNITWYIMKVIKLNSQLEYHSSISPIIL